MSSGGDQPPGKPPGGPKAHPSSTIVGLVPPGADQPAPPASPLHTTKQGVPPPKRSTLPPPIRGPHAAPPVGPTAVPQPASGPVGVPQPASGPPGAPGAISAPATAPTAAPQPLSPTPSQATTAPVSYPYAGHSGPTGVPQPHPGPSSGPTGVPQPNPGPITGPTAMPQPHAGPSAGPTPPAHPYANPAVVATGQPYQQAPYPPAPSYTPGLSPADSIEEVPGGNFVSFLKISMRRAFRLRIEPNEILPAERHSLEHASPPILDRNLQAFLAWRRSVLFLVAVALVPLTVIGLVDAFRNTKWTAIFVVRGAPAFAEGVFCWICWQQLKRWAHWRTQRRKLFWGWLLFMLTPFIVFIYPLRTIFEELGGSSREKLLALGVDGAYRQAVMPFVFAMLAMLQLAPKAISLMPGLIRASMAIKLLFPGSSAPGWLMVMASPLYALLAYVILIIPYQFTGSGWFIAGVLGVVAGQAVLARAGFALAKPMEEAEALRHIKRVRVYYVTVMVVSAVLIVVALGTLVQQFNLRATDVITAVLKFETNVLILTMIGADLVVTNLDRARSYTAGRNHVEEQTEIKIAAFVSLQQPPPPPPGPAQ